MPAELNVFRLLSFCEVSMLSMVLAHRAGKLPGRNYVAVK